MSSFCPKCGAQTRPGARFCGSFGNDMSPFGGAKRKMLVVDEFGNVQMQKV